MKKTTTSLKATGQVQKICPAGYINASLKAKQQQLRKERERQLLNDKDTKDTLVLPDENQVHVRNTSEQVRKQEIAISQMREKQRLLMEGQKQTQMFNGKDVQNSFALNENRIQVQNTRDHIRTQEVAVSQMREKQKLLMEGQKQTKLFNGNDVQNSFILDKNRVQPHNKPEHIRRQEMREKQKLLMEGQKQTQMFNGKGVQDSFVLDENRVQAQDTHEHIRRQERREKQRLLKEGQKQTQLFNDKNIQDSLVLNGSKVQVQNIPEHIRTEEVAVSQRGQKQRSLLDVEKNTHSNSTGVGNSQLRIKQQIKQREEVNHMSRVVDKVQKESVHALTFGNKDPSAKKVVQPTSPRGYDGSLSSFLRLKQQRHQNDEFLPKENRTEITNNNQSTEVLREENLINERSKGDVNITLPNPVANENNSEAVAPKPKTTRGLTMLKDVQTRSLDERKIIILNDKNQPVGPDHQTMKEFSSFLGTVARRESLAPLFYFDWRTVPDKDLIWEFVNTKYIVPDEGKPWVLKTVGDCWRTYKHRIKKKYYNGYETDEEKRENRPHYITEDVFDFLLEYWGEKDVKSMAETNAEIRKNVKESHTAGPMSFARLYYKEQKDGKPMSKADMYLTTRKRKPGKVYKIPDEEVRGKIARIKELQSQEENDQSSLLADEVVGDLTRPRSGYVKLYGRGVKASDFKEERTSTKPSFKVPAACIDAIKLSLEEEMQEKLAEEKAQMEKKLQEKDQQLEDKLQAQSALWQNMFSTFLKQFEADNPELNINNKKFMTLMQIQSPRGTPTDKSQTADLDEDNGVLFEDELERQMKLLRFRLCGSMM